MSGVKGERRDNSGHSDYYYYLFDLNKYKYIKKYSKSYEPIKIITNTINKPAKSTQ